MNTIIDQKKELQKIKLCMIYLKTDDGRLAMKKVRIAIDIGASGGRHLARYMENGKEIIEEVYRFKNYMSGTPEYSLIWDHVRLVNNVYEGLKIAFKTYDRVLSVGLDTWGVDYVLLNKEKHIIEPVFAYRNPRTEKVIHQVHDLISFKKLYEITGSQFQPFNTIYQLYHDKLQGRLEQAKHFLMIPEYLYFKLTGIMIHEFTEASTTGMIDLDTKDFSEEILDQLGYPKMLFEKPVQPGLSNPLSKEISALLGGQTKVYLVATHDTASAVEGVEIEMNQAYLSSGTWSLLGMKVNTPFLTKEAREANFTHEGGLGYIRFQKNIMGLWMTQFLKNELGYDDYFQMADDARLAECCETIDVNDDSFLAPLSMKDAIIDYLKKENKSLPKTNGDILNVVYHSLAKSYEDALNELEIITKRKINTLTIFGGGAQNQYYNEIIRKFSTRKLIIYPIEATAIGNLNVQERYDEQI